VGKPCHVLCPSFFTDFVVGRAPSWCDQGLCLVSVKADLTSTFMDDTGLIDASETAEQAAVRELKEETGYVADSILETSPIVVSDPGT
jgi:hypothetical protein